jgi:restriction endonuclease S subunit
MSWKRVRLGDILTESKIESVQCDPDRRITVRLNFKGVEKRPFEKGVEGGTKYYVRKAGQFIYGKQNLFKGAFGLVPEELDDYESSQDIPTFDIHTKCLPEWLIYFLRQGNFYQSLENIATGTGSRRIQPSRLFDVEIPLPS